MHHICCKMEKVCTSYFLRFFFWQFFFFPRTRHSGNSLLLLIFISMTSFVRSSSKDMLIKHYIMSAAKTPKFASGFVSKDQDAMATLPVGDV